MAHRSLADHTSSSPTPAPNVGSELIWWMAMIVLSMVLAMGVSVPLLGG